MINQRISRGAPVEGATGKSGIAKPRYGRNRYYAAELLIINPHLKWGLLTSLHLTVEGHRILAEKLSEVVKKMVEEKGADWELELEMKGAEWVTWFEEQVGELVGIGVGVGKPEMSERGLRMRLCIALSPCRA